MGSSKLLLFRGRSKGEKISCLLQIMKDLFASYMACNSTNKLEFTFVDPWIKVLGPSVFKFTLNGLLGELNIHLSIT